MPLALYGHPFSSYTQKALIALYENRTPFEFRTIGPDSPEHVAEWLRRWPIAQAPAKGPCETRHGIAVPDEGVPAGRVAGSGDDRQLVRGEEL